MAAQLASEALRRPARRREDQRPGPGRGVRGARDRDRLPHQPDGRRHQRLPGACAIGLRRRPRADRDAPGGGTTICSGRGRRGRRRPPAPVRRADRVRARRRRREGRLLPRQGADRVGPRGRRSWRRTAARADQIADEIGSIVIAHDGCEGKYLGEAGCEPRGHRGGRHRRRRGQPRHLPDGEAPLRRAADDRPGEQPRRTRRCSGTSAWTRSSARPA